MTERNIKASKEDAEICEENSEVGEENTEVGEENTEIGEANVETDEDEQSSSKAVTKKAKMGIIYLSTIPPYMNVTKIQETFGEFGKVGRVYLQLARTESKRDRKKSKPRNPAAKFSEGWVEFEKKSIAKRVARLLNNTQVSTRKRSKQYDCMWSIKYLPGFKWSHLHERLTFEKAARRQKLRTDLQAATQTNNHFSLNIGKKKNIQANVNIENLQEQEEMEVTESEDKTNPEEIKKFLSSIY